MRFLLYTHTFLWFLGGEKRVSGTAGNLIGDSDDHAFLSKMILWEIAIKATLQRLNLAKPPSVI